MLNNRSSGRITAHLSPDSAVKFETGYWRWAQALRSEDMGANIFKVLSGAWLVTASSLRKLLYTQKSKATKGQRLIVFAA